MSRKTPLKSDKYIKISVWCRARWHKPNRARTRIYRGKISFLSVYPKILLLGKNLKALIENEPKISVILATYFDTKIRRMRIAFLLLLDCSRSASLLLSRSSDYVVGYAEPWQRDLPTAENPTTEKAKAKKCCTCFFLFSKPTTVQGEPATGKSPTYGTNQRFTKVKCGSEHLAKTELSSSRGSPTKNPDCYFPSGSNFRYAPKTAVFAL